MAAMAEPPQIAVPTPISVVRLLGTFSNFPKINAEISARESVIIITKKDSFPVFTTWVKLKPAPKNIIAY